MRGAGLSLVGLLFSSLFTFLTRRALARTLGADAYGFLYGVLALMTTSVGAISSGLGEVVCVLVAKYRRLGEEAHASSLFRHALGLRVSIGLAAAVALLFAGPWLLRSYYRFPAGQTAFFVLCLWPPVWGGFWSVQAGLSGRLDFPAQIFFEVGQWVLLYLLVALMVPGHGLTAAALAMVLAPAGLLPFSLGYAWRRHGMGLKWSSVKKPVLAEIWRFSRWTVLTVLGTNLLTSLDTLMLTHLAGLGSVGLYNVAIPISQVFRALMVLPGLFLPVASDLWYAERSKDIAALCRFVVRSVTLYGWAMWILLFAASDVIIHTLFGPAFEPAATPLLILGAGVPLLVVAMFFLNILSSMGRPEKGTRRIWLVVIVDVVLNGVLIPRWGVGGAATATALSYAVLLGLARHGLRGRVPVRLLEPAVLRANLTGAVCGTGAAWAGQHLTGGSALAAGLLATLAFLAMEQRLLVTLWEEGRRLARPSSG